MKRTEIPILRYDRMFGGLQPKSGPELHHLSQRPNPVRVKEEANHVNAYANLGFGADAAISVHISGRVAKTI
jgi:hypothetical protein